MWTQGHLPEVSSLDIALGHGGGGHVKVHSEPEGVAVL